MQMPLTLRGALEREAARFKPAELKRAQERLSESYRAGAPIARMDDAERAAYAVARMPATYAAGSAVLTEVTRRVAELRGTPATLLDLGAGLGSMLWAAAEVLPGINAATLVERDA